MRARVNAVTIQSSLESGRFNAQCRIGIARNLTREGNATSWTTSPQRTKQPGLSNNSKISRFFWGTLSSSPSLRRTAIHGEGMCRHVGRPHEAYRPGARGRCVSKARLCHYEAHQFHVIMIEAEHCRRSYADWFMAVGWWANRLYSAGLSKLLPRSARENAPPIAHCDGGGVAHPLHQSARNFVSFMLLAWPNHRQ